MPTSVTAASLSLFIQPYQPSFIFYITPKPTFPPSSICIPKFCSSTITFSTVIQYKSLHISTYDNTSASPLKNNQTPKSSIILSDYHNFLWHNYNCYYYVLTHLYNYCAYHNINPKNNVSKHYNTVLHRYSRIHLDTSCTHLSQINFSNLPNNRNHYPKRERIHIHDDSNSILSDVYNLYTSVYMNIHFNIIWIDQKKPLIYTLLYREIQLRINFPYQSPPTTFFFETKPVSYFLCKY